ncbi:MAG TPA: hypothetical protein VFI02_10510 [Armatimonadota bacterium]|nr:hypothetical protein [Armatimonadota bacterium]
MSEVRAEISEETLARIMSLPRAGGGPRRRKFSEEEKIALLMFWNHRAKGALSKELHCHENTSRREYDRLVAKDPQRAAELDAEGARLCAEDE